jgi:non-specific serine/threonine protein kinase
MANPDPAEILDELLGLSPDDRASELDRLRSNHPALHGEIVSLLRAFEACPGFLSPPPGEPRALPAQLGKYRIEGELGRGGFGVVYLANDPDLGRSIAVKVLNVTGATDRLREEARIVAAITQPNVATVYTIESLSPGDSGPGSRWLFTMEYVPGRSLSETMRSGSLPIEAALDYGRQIAAGLEAAHGAGVAHGDLSPRNVRVTPEGWVKILDFGLAELAAQDSPEEDQDARTAPSQRGIRGTPGFMSPEQAAGERATPRSDLFSWGAILFECLAGKPAVPGESITELIESSRLGRVSPWPPEPRVPARVRAIVLSSLSLDPSDRPATARDVRQTIEEELLRLRAAPLLASLTGGGASVPTTPRAGNLPATWTSFVGRASELSELSALVRSQRLVTLTGPGGVGKTRLAVEVAALSRPAEPDGVWFVDLAEIRDENDVAAATARALDLHEVRAHSHRDEIVTKITRALARQRLLIVLDNCEHLSQAAARFVMRVLGECPDVRFLVTSRAPLSIPGEQLYAILPMELPSRAEPVAIARTRDAVRLFEARASLRDPSFDPNDAQSAAIIELCGRLDGLPLAIELAASHVRRFPLEAIHERVLSGGTNPGTGTLTPRHRSLVGLVDWSYRLLARADQLLFARLSLFRGGWTLATAEEVCGGEGIEQWEVCDAMSRLVDASLVRIEADCEPARYRFLETIRTFAATRLDDEPEADRHALEDRFIGRMILTSERQGDELRSSSTTLQRIELDYTNLCHAVERSIARGRHDAAYRIGTALGAYWNGRGYWAEGHAWLERIRSAREAAGERPAAVVDPSPGDEAQFLAGAALLAGGLGEWGLSKALEERAVSIARTHEDPLCLGDVLLATSNSANRRHDRKVSRARCEESFEIFRVLRKPAHAASAIMQVGHHHLARSEFERAKAAYRVFFEYAQASGDAVIEAKGLVGLGRCELLSGHPLDAIPLVERALALDPERRAPLGVAIAFGLLGRAYREIGDLREARHNLIESFRLRKRLGHTSAVHGVLVALAEILEDEGRLAPAAEVYAAIRHAYDTARVPANPRERDRVEAGVTRVRDRIDSAEFETILARAPTHDEHSLLGVVTAND